ncbi:hypothetical protein BHM03_00010710 [Ensete ventricosum]|nr:hypothetical protein BHM03_00010710 [Ensete ventricosum]
MLYFTFPNVILPQIAREMVISPRNSRLGLTTLVKRVGRMDGPDNLDSELFKFKCWNFTTKDLPSAFYPIFLPLLCRNFVKFFADIDHI